MATRGNAPGGAGLAYLQLHLCVLLWGFTAILGRLITLDAVAIVAWRMLIVTAALLLLPRVWRGLWALPARLLLVYAGIGAVVALHWLSFYGAIKLANASVAVSCLAIGPAVTALIEPLIAGRRFERSELLLGLAVVPGVVLVLGGVDVSLRAGVWMGLVSAVLAALFASLNKRYVHRADPLLVTGVEIGAGGLLVIGVSALLTAGLSTTLPPPSGADLLWLVALAFGCTLLPFTLALVVLRRLSAYSTQLAVNLEPLYAMALAALIFGEHRELSLSFYLGVALILGAVFVHPYIDQRKTRRALSDSPAVGR